MTRPPNPHRTSWRVNGKRYICGACGAEARNRQAMQIHADVYEPGVRLPTAGLIDEDGDR